MLYLGLIWHMLIPWYDYTLVNSSLYDHLVLWLVISLYALINKVLSLCMIMAIIALLVGRSQSFASLHLYWVWALLVHPTPKNQSFAKCVHHTYLHVVFHCHSKVNCSCATFKTFKIYSCFVFLFSSWGSVEWFAVSCMVTWLHTFTSMHNVLVLNNAKRAKATGAQPKLSVKRKQKQKQINK